MDQDKTQVLPRFVDNNVTQVGQVRIEELPKPKKSSKQKTPKPPRNIKGWVKNLIILIVFIGACVIGFQVMYSVNTNAEKTYNEKLHTVQELKAKVDTLSQEQNKLNTELASLQNKQQVLNQEQDNLSQKKSFFEELIDEITGKADEDASKLKSVEDQLKSTKNTINNLQSKIEETKNLKDKAVSMHDKAEAELNRYQGEWGGFVYKLKLFLNNINH